MKKIETIAIIGILCLSMLPILKPAAKAEPSEAYLTNFLQLTTNSMRDRSPICSPDGSRIAYFAFDSSNWYRHIWTMNPDGSGKTQITFGGVIDETGDYSPDGTKIVFMRYRGSGIFDIWVMDSDGTDAHALTSTGLYHGSPRWSHGGQRLAFYYGSAGTNVCEIHIMNADGTNELTVVSSSYNHMNVFWSSDDTKLFYTMDDGIWFVNTSPPYTTTRLYQTSLPTMHVTCSPDGEYILYASGVWGQYQNLYLIDANGNFIAQLTEDTSIEYAFDWSSDGQNIFFSSIRSGNTDIWSAKIVIGGGGPVGYWKFDEGSGNIAYDSSGNGNDGTLINNPQWIDGIDGNALLLDGTASFVDVPSSASLVIHGDQIAVEMWMKPSINLDSSTPTMDLMLKGNEYGFMINHDVSDGKIVFVVGIVIPGYFQGEGISTTTDHWTANTWYHLVGTYDGNSIKIYVNGVLENSRAVSGDLWTQEPSYVEYPLSIGAYTWMDASPPYGTIYGRLFFFNGAIDEVKIYSCARTAEEILNDYNSLKVAIPWRDDFNYNSKNEMKTAGWSLEHEELINVGGGVLTLDDDGSAMARSFFRNFASGIYDFKVETKAKWTGRTYGSLLLFVETKRHKYSLHLDGYYPNYAFVRDRAQDEIRFGGYVPQFDTWLTMGFEKRGNTIILSQNDNIIYTCVDPDTEPDALTGVGIAPGWISTNKYDYISVSTPSQPDFDISTPESQITQPDSSVSCQIAITSKNGFSSSVTLAASSSPYYECYLLPAIVTPTPNGQVTATLEFDTYTDTPLRTYTITITATGGGISKSNSIRLNVERSLEVPYQNQGYAQWCSPTSMAMVLRYYGYAFHGWDYAKAKHLSTDQGVRIEEMKPYIDDNYKNLTAKVGYYGLPTLPTKSVVLDDIRSNLTSGFPVIIQLGKLVWGFPSIEGHAVVATGFNETGLFINDPSGALFTEEGFLHLTSTDPKYPKSWIHAYVEWSDIYQFIRTAPFASIMAIQGIPRPADNLGSIYVTSRIGVIFYHPGDGQGGVLTQDYYSLYLNKGLVWMKNYSKQQKWEIKEDNVIASDCNALFVSLGVANSGSMTQSFKFYLDILDSKGVVQPLTPRPINNLAGFKEDKESASGGFIDVSQFLTKGVQYRLDLHLRDSSEKVVDHFQSEPFYWVEATKAKLTEDKKHLYLHAYDKQGNHIGLDYTSGQIELGIPESYYYDDGSGTITLVVPQIIDLQLLVDAEYAEEPIESYNLTVTTNSDAGSYLQTYSGNIAVGDKHTFTTEASETSLTLYLDAEVDLNPDALNLVSKGESITVYIALPRGIDLSNIDVSSILLNKTIPVKPSAPVTIGDYNNDGVPDLMVKFDRSQVINYVLAHVPNSARFMAVTLTVTGYLNDGTAFRGSDTIRIIFSKPIAK